MKTKPLRQTMPTVAAFIDDLRAAFGPECINAAIRNGMAGGSQFYASENGHTIGAPSARRAVILTPPSAVRAKGETP